MWENFLSQETQKPYFLGIKEFLVQEHNAGKSIYPPINDMMNAFTLTPFEDIKVVILGQDPYHGPNQAHGLAFSVQKGVPPPPSLKNIFKELETDISIPQSTQGDLTLWAKRGVFLLNSILSVEAHKPGSHKDIGWETFTDATIQYISTHKKNIVFVLWGQYAISKSTLIDTTKHLILTSPHPSPFSAHRGFFGNKPFSKINLYLQKYNLPPIDWNLIP